MIDADSNTTTIKHKDVEEESATATMNMITYPKSYHSQQQQQKQQERQKRNLNGSFDDNPIDTIVQGSSTSNFCADDFDEEKEEVIVEKKTEKQVLFTTDCRGSGSGSGRGRSSSSSSSMQVLSEEGSDTKNASNGFASSPSALKLPSSHQHSKLETMPSSSLSSSGRSPTTISILPWQPSIPADVSSAAADTPSEEEDEENVFSRDETSCSVSGTSTIITTDTAALSNSERSDGSSSHRNSDCSSASIPQTSSSLRIGVSSTQRQQQNGYNSTLDENLLFHLLGSDDDDDDDIDYGAMCNIKSKEEFINVIKIKLMEEAHDDDYDDEENLNLKNLILSSPELIESPIHRRVVYIGYPTWMIVLAAVIIGSLLLAVIKELSRSLQ